ncbi:MAG: type II secretion system protein [Oscillospiraceae bacterium]|nr:type II secretion system protein [Oscillospiraceae bacterium]
MKKKKASLKGFTLIELIVVVAIFGIIMGIALGLMEPADRIYKASSEAADVQQIGDYMRRFVQDNIQYSDRLTVYTNMTLAENSSPGSVLSQVQKFKQKYSFPPDATKERIDLYTGFKDKNEVYVLQINNPSPTVLAAPVAKNAVLGTVTLRKFIVTGGATKEDLSFKKVWGANTDYYDDYAFNINLQTLAEVTDLSGVASNQYVNLNESLVSGVVSPSNFVMKIDLYKKVRIKGDLNNANLVDGNTNKTIAFKLKNLVNETGAISTERIDFKDPLTPSEDVRRFCWYDNTMPNAETLNPGEVGSLESSSSNDIYIIFTKAPQIEKIIAAPVTSTT